MRIGMTTDKRPNDAAKTLAASGELRSGWTLGRPFGVAIVADYSLLLIFGLIALNLGSGLFPFWHPDWPVWLCWTVALCAAVAFVASIALHELCHALVAKAQGMSVRRIHLFVFGGMAEIQREPRTARAEFWMAVVGPLASIALGIGSAWLGGYLTMARIDPDVLMADPSLLWRLARPGATLLLWLGPLNLFLGIFNLIPGFPLDGGRVLRSLLWWLTGNLRMATRVASGVGQGFAWLLMALGAFMLFGYSFPWLGGGPLQGLWVLLIGWFLNNAARMSYQQLVVQQTLESVRVRDLMRSRVETVDPDLPLSEFVRAYVMNTDQVSFPVLQAGAVVGLVRTNDVRTAPHERWEELRVRDVMVPRSQLHVIAPDDPALEALRHLAEHDPVPVVDHDHFVGVARRDDVIKWLALHAPASV